VQKSRRIRTVGLSASISSWCRRMPVEDIPVVEPRRYGKELHCLRHGNPAVLSRRSIAALASGEQDVKPEGRVAARHTVSESLAWSLPHVWASAGSVLTVVSVFLAKWRKTHLDLVVQLD
jgi:hypothetical protein